jgi:hypothetical protein
MERIMYQLSRAAAALTFLVALSGGGLASDASWYQVKAPERLCK